MPVANPPTVIEIPDYPIEISTANRINLGPGPVEVLRYYRQGQHTWAYIRHMDRETHKFKSGSRWIKVHRDHECWSLVRVTEYTGIGQRMGYMTVLSFVVKSRHDISNDLVGRWFA